MPNTHQLNTKIVKWNYVPSSTQLRYNYEVIAQVNPNFYSKNGACASGIIENIMEQAKMLAPAGWCIRQRG